jgi:hypothetical protein
MKDEFDIDPEDLDFEAFDSNLNEEDFEDFEDDEMDDVSVRTAILSKNNMLALLCVKTATEGGAICRVDPRESRPAVQIYDDPQKAIEWFTKSLQTSRKNGWLVVYDGLPLQG